MEAEADFGAAGGDFSGLVAGLLGLDGVFVGKSLVARRRGDGSLVCAEYVSELSMRLFVSPASGTGPGGVEQASGEFDLLGEYLEDNCGGDGLFDLALEDGAGDLRDYLGFDGVLPSDGGMIGGSAAGGGLVTGAGAPGQTGDADFVDDDGQAAGEDDADAGSGAGDDVGVEPAAGSGGADAARAARAERRREKNREAARTSNARRKARNDALKAGVRVGRLQMQRLRVREMALAGENAELRRRLADMPP